MKIITIIKEDLFRRSNGKRGLCCFFKLYITVPEFKYMFWLRVTIYFKNHFFFRYNLYYITAIKKYFLSRKYGIFISSNMKIGRGMRIDHFGGIFLSSSTVIGNNCNISAGVVFGNVPRGLHAGVPNRIGDRVYIGIGAKIIGNVTIGNDVVIGANSVVSKSLPDFSVVQGVPARIISMDGSSDYINNKV